MQELKNCWELEEGDIYCLCIFEVTDGLFQYTSCIITNGCLEWRLKSKLWLLYLTWRILPINSLIEGSSFVCVLLELNTWEEVYFGLLEYYCIDKFNIFKN
jgi:hypothetical protein